MYRYNDTLAKLPIPDLFETIREYMEWIKPLVTEEEYSKTQNVVGEFIEPDGLGVKLQDRLISSSNSDTNKSWLKPMWDEMYLSYRGPLVLNMNYYAVMENEAFKDKLTYSQLMALAIVKSVQTYFSISDESMEPDMGRKVPMCMNQYKNTLKAVRIPCKDEDLYKLGEDSKVNNYIMLLYMGRTFQVFVSDSKGNIYSPELISAAIDKIVELNLEAPECSIGAFTTAPRDIAADIYEELLKDNKNRHNLDLVNDAVLVVCLDKKFNTENDLIKAFLLSDGSNRYFDKSSQIIVTEDCQIGFNNEHTGADGTTWFSIMDSIYDYIISNTHVFTSKDVDEVPFNHLDWNISKDIERLLNNAIEAHRKIAESIYTQTKGFNTFGKEHIKSLGVSPDAFFHIALQLAQYRTFNSLKSTYEPVAMREYREGRTECTRPVTEAVKTLVTQFDSCIDNDILKKLILDAVNAHISRIKTCQSGNGIERHLYGLSKMQQMYFKDETLNLFDDASYKKLKSDFISTSGLGSENIRCFGFGPVIEDGFGLGYGIKKHNIALTISTKKSNQYLGERLMQNLHKAFNDIAKILV